MNIDRFKHLWKIFSHINRTKEYGHIFKHGASVDSMLGYINRYVGRTGCGGGPISKQEIRDVLKIAKEKGYIQKIYRYCDGTKTIEHTEYFPKLERIPSRWKFLKG